jgi:hypothetical protein
MNPLPDWLAANMIPASAIAAAVFFIFHKYLKQAWVFVKK